MNERTKAAIGLLLHAWRRIGGAEGEAMRHVCDELEWADKLLEKANAKIEEAQEQLKLEQLNEVLKTETEVSKQLNITATTLQAWRSKSKGPRFIKIGSCVRYDSKDITEWLEANTKETK
jgi:predicted DNA-binding transcriptional regulator AlpA